MNIKKMTHKDRYGNQISYEYEVPEKPLDPTAIVTKGMELEAENRPDVMIQETMMAVPPVMGEQFNMGNPVTHPGQPMGEDTVPAWLTPGEFVVNAEATEMFGPQIEAMNEAGREVQNLNKGGPARGSAAGIMAGMDPSSIVRMMGSLGNAYQFVAPALGMNEGGKTMGDWIPFVEGNQEKSIRMLRERAKQGDDHATSILEQNDLYAPKPDRKVSPLGAAAAAAALAWKANPIYRAGQIAGAGLKGAGRALMKEEGGEIPMPIAPPWTQKPAGIDDLLHEREGFVDSIYLDSLNKPTVGYGHLIADEEWAKDDPRIGTKPYSQKELDKMFDEDRDKAQREAVENVGRKRWTELTPEQQTAMTSMAFQLGGAGQRKFKKLLAAIEAGDNREVAKQALTGSKGGKSKWLKQTPKRALDLAMAFDPDLAAQYKNAGGQVFDDEPHQRVLYREGGGFTNFLNKYILGDKTQIGAAPAAAAEIPVPEATPTDMFPPGIVDVPNTGHPYANAIQAGIDPVAEDMSIPGSSVSPAAAGEIEDMTIPGSSISPAAEGNFGATGASVPPVNDMDVPGAATDDGGLMNWIFQDNRPDSVKEAEANFNQKIAEGNREEVDATLQNILDRQAKGLPVNEKTLEGAKKAADYQDDNLIEQIDDQAAVGAISSDEAEAAKKQIQTEKVQREMDANQAAYENEAFGHIGGKENQGKPKLSEEEKANTLDQYFAEPPAADETGPGKDQPGNDATTGEVEAAGNGAPKGEVDKAKGVMKSIFGDLFDPKELQRMAIMYAGSRLLGFSHAGSARWAAKQYVGRVDAKSAQFDKLVASGKYTPASLAEYKKTGDVSMLKAPGATYNPTGNATVKMVNGKKVALQEVKDKNGAVYYQGPNGNLMTAAQIATAPDYEPSFDKGTPEYRERRNRARTNSEARFDEVWKAEDRFRVGENEWKTTTNIRPKQAADEFWAWSESMGMDPESDEALQIMTNAYQEAIADGKGGEVKPNSLKPYLENQYIREKTGAPELFMVNEPKPGEKPQYVRGDKMAQLDRNVDFISTQLPALQGLSAKDASARFYEMAMSEWNQLDPDDQKFYSKSASKGESGFYYFVNKRANDLQQKLGG